MKIKKFKYPITEEKLEQSLKELSKIIKLDDKIFFLIKNQVYKNCPDNILTREEKKEIILYRIATRVPTSEKDFLPHMYSDKMNIFPRRIIEIARKIKFNRRSKEKIEILISHFCSRFSISTFEKLEDAIEITNLLKKAKVILEGKVNQELDGPIYKNSFDSSSHKDWFPFQKANELEIFTKTVFCLLTTECKEKKKLK